MFRGRGGVTYCCSPCKKLFKTCWHLNRHNAQVHANQKKKKKIKKVTNPIDPEMFIDLSLLVSVSSDSDDLYHQ